MSERPDSSFDQLWKDYGQVFREFDDLTLARWLAQTLGQLEGKAWRFSHPLLTTYRLASQVGHERQIWLKRLSNPPHAYPEAPCCRAPSLPLLTRDVGEMSLICLHCNETLVPLDELPASIKKELLAWAEEYDPIHAVAHWDDRQRKSSGDYEMALEKAAETAEVLLAKAGRELAPKLLEIYPALVWEDGDECLEVRAEDVNL